MKSDYCNRCSSFPENGKCFCDLYEPFFREESAGIKQEKYRIAREELFNLFANDKATTGGGIRIVRSSSPLG